LSVLAFVIYLLRKKTDNTDFAD